MDRAVLLTGDRDFTPLVETLVQFGLIVVVAGDFRSTSDVLAGAADVYQPLGLTEYWQLVDVSLRQKYQLPSFNGGLPPDSEKLKPLAEGPVGTETGCVLARAPVGFYMQIHSPRGSRYAEMGGSTDLKRLQLFIKLQLGEVPWLEAFTARFES